MEYLHSQVYQFGKLFQACQSVVEDLFREERVNELQSDLREITVWWNLSDLFHCFVPLELYFTTKISLLPALVFPSRPPVVSPATNILSDESVAIP